MAGDSDEEATVTDGSDDEVNVNKKSRGGNVITDLSAVQ